MRSHIVMFILFFLLLFLAPSAMAHGDTIVQRGVATYYAYAHFHSHPEGAVGPGCPTFCPTPDTETVVRFELWEESNGCPGLQRVESDCSGMVTPADERLREFFAYAP